MHRKGLAVFIAISIVMTLVAPAMAEYNPFPDLPHDHWAYDSVTGLAAAGLVEGFPDGTFGGDRTFTRYEMAQVFARILKRMENLLSAEIDEKIAARSAYLEQQVADAAARANNALTAALLADSRASAAQKSAVTAADMATMAGNKADEANIAAITAQSTAEEAYGLAIRAKQLADLLSEQIAKLQAIGDAVANDDTWALAESALKTAQEAQSLAEQAMALAEKALGMSATDHPDLAKYLAALKEAKELAARAAELAAKASTAEEIAAAREAAEAARRAAAKAEDMARRAATLEDLAKTMSRAEEAYALAVEANAKAIEAQVTANEARYLAGLDRPFTLTDDAKKAILEYVSKILAGKLDELGVEAPEVIKEYAANPIVATGVEEIASRIVAEQMASVLGRVSDLEKAQAAAQGDLVAIRQLLDAKAAEIAASVEALSHEFSAELKEMGIRLDQLAQRVDNIDITVQKLGSEVQSGFNMLEDKVARNSAAIEELQDRVANTKAYLRSELVITEANPAAGANNSLFVDPREPLASDKASRNDWYDNRLFAKDESQLRLALDIATVPAPGATLAGSVYINRQFPGYITQQAGIGIDMDLTTKGVLQKLHVGELDADSAVAGFSKYVLDAEKWNAQLWRINGLQASLQAGVASANVLTGYGFVKNVDVDGRTGNDLPGDTAGAITAASIQAPIGDALKVGANWLNLPVSSANPNSKPVSVAALELSGAKGALEYGASVASSNSAEIGDVYLAQQLGSVRWTADYRYTDKDWTQRLAKPEYDGLSYPADRHFALEISGFKPLDFDTRLAHIATTAYDGDKRNVWMIRGERDLNVVLPLKAIAEIGGNNGATQEPHTMVDLGVVNWTPGNGKVGLDVGYRFENTPIEAEDWAMRWRNTSIRDAAAVANTAPAQHQNWVPDTVRKAIRAKATWHVSENAVLYVGSEAKTDTNVTTKTDAQATNVTAGLSLAGNIFGAKAKAQYELVNSSLAAGKPKHSVALGLEGGLGKGTITAELERNVGQGTDTADAQDSVAKLAFQLPVYEGVNFYMDGRYAKLQGSATDDYEYGAFLTGIKMAL